MNTLHYLIIRRYLRGIHSERNISTMALISFLGIFIGSFALALVASIMNGFEKMTHKKLQGIHAQIIMRASSNLVLDSQKIEVILSNEFPEITAYSPSAYKQVLIKKPGDEEISNAVFIKAINANAEEKTSSIGTSIIKSVESTKKLENIIDSQSIVIGNKLADILDLQPGKKALLLFIFQQPAGNKITLESKEVNVSGIFSTGIEEYDNGLVLTSFELLEELFHDAGITQYNIQLRPYTNELIIIDKLKKRFKLDVFSWRELYPSLVTALKLEKYAMSFILALIVLVATMNIISLLFMQINQKKSDIAIYQAMGMHKRTLIKIFMAMGISLSTIATVAGLFTAYAAGVIIQSYPFISLPDTYYLSHLPIHMEWSTFFFIFCLSIIMSLLATWIACRKIESVNAASILRFQG